MARFNVQPVNPRATRNHEDERAYKMLNDEMDLYARCACFMGADGFYTPENEQNCHIFNLIEKCDANYVAALAAYIRKRMYMRTVPIMMLTKLAMLGRLRPHMVTSVVSRADEITELLAAWQAYTGRADLKKIPNALKKGIARCFGKFSSYQFRKYNRQGKGQVTFRDAMRLCHPKPMNDEQNKIFQDIKQDTLETIETWETILSSNTMSKKEAWEQLISEDKVPYMALLRNLRNILKAEVGAEYIDKVCHRIQDPDYVKNSKQFPFRWLSAYRELKKMDGGDAFLKSSLMDSIVQAAIISLGNVHWFDSIDRMLVACDTSGSMSVPVSARSSVTLMDVGLTLGSLLKARTKQSVFGVFGDTWIPIPIPQIFGDYRDMAGWSTQAHKVIDWANDKNQRVDKFLFFSDNQIYSLVGKTFGTARDKSEFERAWNQYKAKVNPNAKCYLFNLSSEDTTPIDVRRNDVYFVTGWSEKIFQVLDGVGDWDAIREEIMRCQ